MKLSSILAMIMVANVLGFSAIAPAWAETQSGATDSAEVQILMTAKLTVAQAAAAAEASLGGRTINVGLEDKAGQPIYEVTLLAADGTELEATVDAMTGTVTKVASTEDTGNADESENAGEEGADGESDESGEGANG